MWELRASKNGVVVHVACLGNGALLIAFIQEERIRTHVREINRRETSGTKEHYSTGNYELFDASFREVIPFRNATGKTSIELSCEASSDYGNLGKVSLSVDEPGSRSQWTSANWLGCCSLRHRNFGPSSCVSVSALQFITSGRCNTYATT